MLNAIAWILWILKNNRVRILHEEEVIVNKRGLDLINDAMTQFDINLRKKGMSYTSSAGTVAGECRHARWVIETTRRH